MPLRHNFTAEQLAKFKEGQVVTDPVSGKTFRVHKSVYPEPIPEDRALSRIESEWVLPEMIHQEILKNYCSDAFKALGECMKKGPIKGLRDCQEAKDIFQDCKARNYSDAQLRETVTERYLKERAEFRRGERPQLQPTEKEKKLRNYRQWKAEQRQ